MKFLVILANSKDIIVCTKLFVEFKDLIQHYGSAVIEVLEEQFSIFNEKEIFFEKKVREVYENYYELQELKNDLNEFNPKINQKNLVLKYNKIQNRIQKKEMQDSRKKFTFLSMVNKTTLLRGRSWKIEGSKNIRPLLSHKVEFLFPSRYHSYPEYFDYTLIKNKANWGDIK